tara:strand:+ start:1350 stop:1508 length:159 start_codon:yes stop_codon:yes gene_type:complete
MEDEGGEISRIYVRKNRESYSGMMLDSIFGILRKAIVVIVILGISGMIYQLF